MKTQKVKINIEARKAFQPFLNSSKRFSVLVCHRRAGKTVAVIQKLIKEALTNKRKGSAPLRFAYIAPTRDQAKDIAWSYLKDYTSKIPGVSVNEAELRITLPNKAQIRLYSGDNYERMRGLYFDGVVSDEDADIDPNAFLYVILPCLMDYDGWHCRIGTPKGKNAFWKAYTKAIRDDDKYAMKLKASESGILSENSQKTMRDLMTKDAWDQEMECDFNVKRPGAIYAECMTQAWDKGRIYDFDVDPEVPVYTTWDLGSPENTVVIYWQRVGFQHRIIDCDHYGSFDGKNITTLERVTHMKEKGYNYAGHFIPHDSRKIETDGMSFETKLKKAGLLNVRSIPREGHRAEEKRIRAMGDIFSLIFFRKSACAGIRQPGSDPNDPDDLGEGGLIDALENYHRRIDKKTQRVQDDISHDWSSHFADAFGYYSEAAKHRFFKDETNSYPTQTNAEVRTHAPGRPSSRDRANRNTQTSAMM